MPFTATWMPLEVIILSEVSLREKNTTWYHLYVESKIWHKWTSLWSRHRLRHRELTCSCQGGNCPRARHPGVWIQVGLRKHHYEQSRWRWRNSSWAISNPKRWCCESAALNMPANLEDSAVATGLDKVSFSFQSQRKAMLKNVQIITQWYSFHMPAGLCSKSFKLGFSNR